MVNSRTADVLKSEGGLQLLNEDSSQGVTLQEDGKRECDQFTASSATEMANEVILQISMHQRWQPAACGQTGL